MKIVMTCLLSVSLLMMTSACDQKTKEPANPISADYKSWYKPLKAPVEYPIPGHGKSRRIIYANQTALQARIGKDNSNNTVVIYPDGSVIIKEIYKPEGDSYQEVPQLTVMMKDKNNKDAHNGWLYYVKNPGESEPKLITNRFCAGCHEAANEAHPYFDKNPQGIFRDYLFVNLAR